MNRCKKQYFYDNAIVADDLNREIFAYKSLLHFPKRYRLRVINDKDAVILRLKGYSYGKKS